jgi:hypothetical protein
LVLQKQKPPVQALGAVEQHSPLVVHAVPAARQHAFPDMPAGRQSRPQQQLLVPSVVQLAPNPRQTGNSGHCFFFFFFFFFASVPTSPA